MADLEKLQHAAAVLKSAGYDGTITLEPDKTMAEFDVAAPEALAVMKQAFA